MKFSRLQLILIVGVVGLLALSVLMAVWYVGAVGKTPQLEEDINQWQAKIDELEGSYDIAALIAQRDALEEQIANEAPFPAGPFEQTSIYDDQQITDAIFKVTDDAYVDLNSLTHKSKGTIVIGGSKYQTDTYNLRCSIEDPDKWERLITLLELFEELREDVYSTLIVDGVKLPSGRVSIDFSVIIVTQVYKD